MNLISCNQCGVVIDKDKVIFPDIYDYKKQEIIDGNSEWNGRDYVSIINCPACGRKILER